jgi:uncharacterized membrane protein (UPF0127 family)
MRRWTIVYLVLGILAAASVGGVMVMPKPTSADGRAMQLPVDPAPLVVETQAGARRFTVEVADDFNERSRGLMFRESMADDHGMLFVFEQMQEVGFWMHNTPMPLDLLFIGQDGRVKDILPGKPFSDAIIAPREPVRFVLEFKQGTAARTGIRAGDVIRHPAITEAPGAANPG